MSEGKRTAVQAVEMPEAPQLRASVVEELQQSIRPRDLILEKDRAALAAGKTSQATYVVNKSEVGKAVSASITLTHVQ